MHYNTNNDSIMKKLFLAPVLGLALVACGNTASNSTADSTATVDSTQTVEQVAAPALEGTFVGLLPSADSEGFDTTIVFNADGTYTETATAKGTTSTEQGVFALAGDTLTLTAESSQKLAVLRGDSISLLDADKKEPTPAYVLRKK